MKKPIKIGVLGDTGSVSNYGFKDAVVSFGSLRWVIPLQDAVAMNVLEEQCTKAQGSSASMPLSPATYSPAWSTVRRRMTCC